MRRDTKLWIGGALLLAFVLGCALPSLFTPEKAAASPTTVPLGRMTPMAISTSAGATSNAAVLPAVAGATTYITGFNVTGGGATSASIIEVAITGLPTTVGTLKFEMNVAAGATAAVNAQGGLYISFPDPIPASAVNSAITVTCPSLGSGNTNASVTAFGFSL